MAIFTILILPNHEHGMFLHLFVSSLISLSSGLQFFLKRSFTVFVSCIPSYVILFVAIVDGSSFLIWLPLSLLLVYRNACDFCPFILYPQTLLKLLISFRRFWAEMMGSSEGKLLLFLCLVEFGCEPIWTWAFFGWQAVNCCLNLRPCYQSIQGFDFLLVQTGRMQVSRNVSISSWFTSLCAYSCL